MGHTRTYAQLCQLKDGFLIHPAVIDISDVQETITFINKLFSTSHRYVNHLYIKLIALRRVELMEHEFAKCGKLFSISIGLRFWAF